MEMHRPALERPSPTTLPTPGGYRTTPGAGRPSVPRFAERPLVQHCPVLVARPASLPKPAHDDDPECANAGEEPGDEGGDHPWLPASVSSPRLR